MAGSRYLLECDKPEADYAIIGEPTAMRPLPTRAQRDDDSAGRRHGSFL